VTRRLVTPAALLIVTAAATAAAAISLLLRPPGEVAIAAARGDVGAFWQALWDVLAGALVDLLRYL